MGEIQLERREIGEERGRVRGKDWKTRTKENLLFIHNWVIWYVLAGRLCKMFVYNIALEVVVNGGCEAIPTSNRDRNNFVVTRVKCLAPSVAQF